jgi:hypothetical protein
MGHIRSLKQQYLQMSPIKACTGAEQVGADLITEIRVVIIPSILYFFTQCTFFVCITSNETKFISLQYAHGISYQVEMELGLQSAVWHQHVRGQRRLRVC